MGGPTEKEKDVWGLRSLTGGFRNAGGWGLTGIYDEAERPSES